MKQSGFQSASCTALRSGIKPARQSGFTLIEAVVSVLILALMSVMAYQGVDVVLGANERSHEALAEEVELQKVWRVIANDLVHLRARAFADGLGSMERAYQTGQDDALLRFTRGGNATLSSNPTGLNRINYTLKNGDFYRHSWPVYISPRDEEPNEQLLLKGVNNIVFEQLNSEYLFTEFWPPINEVRSLVSLPPMVRVTIELADGSYTTREFLGIDNGF